MSIEAADDISDIKTASTKATAHAVLEFFNQSQIKQELHWFTHEDTIERAQQRDDRRLYYLTGDDDVVAAVMIWCESRILDASQAQIRQIATDSNYRQRGLARRLCTRSEAFAADYGMRQMVADAAADTVASEFWRGMGYTAVEDWTTDSSRQMVRFRKSLDIDAE